MFDIFFEKSKGRDETVNRLSVSAEQPSEEFFKEGVMRNSTKFTRLILITAVSIVVKGELAKETVNYGTKIKAQVPI